MSPSDDDRDALATIIDEARRKNGTAQDLILSSIRRAILSGILAPGARLRQEELADAFGTSRIPVREALRVLEYEGLLTSEPHRGFRVTVLNADDVDEVYDLRIVLESHAVRLAMPMITDEDLHELRALLDAMTAATSPDEQLALRERFYLQIYGVTGRPRLVQAIMRLRQEVARSLRWATIPHSTQVHEQLFEAVQAGDADAAAATLSSHYRRVATLIRRYIKEEARDRTGSANSAADLVFGTSRNGSTLTPPSQARLKHAAAQASRRATGAKQQ